MNIGYDGKRAVANLTGLGNYSRLVLESVAEACPDDTLTVFAPRPKDNPRLSRLRERDNVSFVYNPHPRLIPAPLWRSYGITPMLKPHSIDLYHGLSNELPLNIARAGIPSVVTIHDVIYRRLPWCYGSVDRFMCDFKYSRSCHAATRIIAISECTRRDIMHYYGIPEEKIDIVYQGCDDIFRRRFTPAQIEDVRHIYDLPDRYILQVGTIERRKNAELSVRALATIADRDISLVIVGRDNHYKEFLTTLARQHGVEGRVQFIHNVTFPHLPAVNQGAEIILYPSLYEGFGIPILEALESHRPVIAATGSCLEEAGGDAALYVDPYSPRQLAEAIDAILNHTVDPDSMIARGLTHAARFSNSTIARSILDVYRRCLTPRN